MMNRRSEAAILYLAIGRCIRRITQLLNVLTLHQHISNLASTAADAYARCSFLQRRVHHTSGVASHRGRGGAGGVRAKALVHSSSRSSVGLHSGATASWLIYLAPPALVAYRMCHA